MADSPRNISTDTGLNNGVMLRIRKDRFRSAPLFTNAVVLSHTEINRARAIAVRSTLRPKGPSFRRKPESRG